MSRADSTARRLLFAAAVSSLLVGSCGGHRSLDARKARPTSTSAVQLPSTTSTAASPDVQPVIQAYVAFWAALGSVAFDMRPADPALADHAMGTELDKLRVRFTKLLAQHMVLRGQIATSQGVVSSAIRSVVITGETRDTATLVDCYDDSDLLKYEVRPDKSLVLADTVDRRRSLVEVTLRRDQSNWKVAAIDDKGRGCTAA